MLTTPTTRPTYSHVEYLYECYLADPSDCHGKHRLLQACDHMGLLEDRDRILWENGMLHSDAEIAAAAATVNSWLDNSVNKPSMR